MSAPRSVLLRVVLWGVAGLILVVGLALRVAAAAGDFGIDEISSMRIAALLQGPLAAFRVRHDNNHILNTMWLYWLGADHAAVVYRAPSILAGVVTIVVGGVIARHHGRAAALTTALLLCVSTLLVNSASEARGYAPAMAFIACSVWLLERRLAGSRSRWLAALFGACQVLAMLCHLSAAVVCAALGFHWLVQRARRGDRRTLVAEAFTLHALPGLAALALFLFFVRGMQVGGGATNGKWNTLMQTAGLVFGLPLDAPSLALGACVVAGLGVLALTDLWRRDDSRWVLYTVGIGFPLLGLAMYDITYAAPRYILMSVFFLLLALGSWLGRAIERTGAMRLAGIGVWCTLVTLNFMGDLELARLGRGSFRQGVAFIISQSKPGPISVMSDHDFRNPLLLSYYARFHPQGDRLVYWLSDHLPAEGVEWLILHRTCGESPPVAQTIVNGDHYTRRLALPTAALSGISWFIYRRDPPAARTPDTTAPQQRAAPP
ncbi:MAG TPA: glycosyltransferase family 39 protein [Polyangiales bacterium]